MENSEKNQTARKKLSREEMDEIVAKARKSEGDKMKGYREKSLSIHFRSWRLAKLPNASHGVRTSTNRFTIFTSGGLGASVVCFAPLYWELVSLWKYLLTSSHTIYSACSTSRPSFQTQLFMIHSWGVEQPLGKLASWGAASLAGTSIRFPTSSLRTR